MKDLGEKQFIDKNNQWKKRDKITDLAVLNSCVMDKRTPPKFGTLSTNE